MSIFRTIALFIYLFGYMIVHYGALRRGERALAAGDTQLVEELVNKNIPRWSRGILKVTGVSLVVEGLENIPKDTACVFVGNHRSYYDIPLLLASLDKPHGVLAKEELEKPFAQEAELAEKRMRLAQLNSELNIDDKAPIEAAIEDAQDVPSIREQLRVSSEREMEKRNRNQEREER